MAQARRQVAGSIRGFVCQKLIPKLEGVGRVPSNEILNADATIKNLILEGHFDKIQGIMEGGSDSNSFSFNKDIFRLIKAGVISKADGIRYSSNPQQLEMNLKGIFIKS
jgi:twitching motility protein PilT